MLGGPVMNLLIAIVLTTAVVVGFGQLEPTTTLERVSTCVLPLDAPADAACTDADLAAPAAAAGLLPGDTIVAFGGDDVSGWDQLADQIAQTGGETTSIVVERDGQRVETEITPVVTDRPVYDADGAPTVDASGDAITEPAGFLGIGPTEELEGQSITLVPGMIGERLSQTASVMLTLPQRLVDVAQAVFGDEERDENSVIGVVGIGRFAGEITSSDVDGYGVELMSADLLMILAGLNIALFTFNLIPLLPLDGGHVLGALYEGARRQVARVRGRERSLPADTARMMPLAYGVFVVLAAMGVLLVYADIVKPIRLT